MRINDVTINKQRIQTYDSAKASKSGSIMTRAIKAYRDELLTGLTDEEKEEINKKIEAYLKNKPIKTDADKMALNNFIKGLLSQYGYKGNCEDYAAVMGANAIGNNEETAEEQKNNLNNEEALTAFQKNSAAAETAKIRILE